MSHTISNIRQPAALLIQPALSRHDPGRVTYPAGGPGSVVFPGQGMTGTVPVRGVDRTKHNAHSPWSASLYLRRDGQLLVRQIPGVPTMKTLDVVDWFFLLGGLVYFGLLVLRRI